jgi:formiminotetrahydrofolate cyclodeaminase
MLKDMTIEEFLNETASDSPAPGGGSVSALVGALGAALSSMVGELSVGKEANDDIKTEIINYMNECRSLMNGLKESIDKDTDAFNAVMAAFRMPKGTEEEKSKRSKEIQSAIKNAAEVPYNTAVLCLRVMDIATKMLKKGNKNAASDAAVSGLLGYAALNGALYNVKINLNSIKDEQYVQQVKKEVENLTLKGEELLSTIKALSQETIG